jgi:hypothetical protein
MAITINIPPQYDTDLEKVKYLYRLYELIRVYGNTYRWDAELKAVHRIWCNYVLQFRNNLSPAEWQELKENWKQDHTITCELNDIEGYEW